MILKVVYYSKAEPRYGSIDVCRTVIVPNTTSCFHFYCTFYAHVLQIGTRAAFCSDICRLEKNRKEETKKKDGKFPNLELVRMSYQIKSTSVPKPTHNLLENISFSWLAMIDMGSVPSPNRYHHNTTQNNIGYSSLA